MRQVVLDTETTGLEPGEGHRIIEIGAVELEGRRLTGETWHRYIQPDRDIDDGALAVHGITLEFLADKPRFDEVANSFLEFINGAELIIHNAPFDLAFLNLELSRLTPCPGRIEDTCTVLDSLTVARRKHPGQKNSLDALCRRYMIDNAQRTLHGALLDAEILADVYLAMTGGQTLMFAQEQDGSADDPAQRAEDVLLSAAQAMKLKVVKATGDELSAHAAQLDLLDGACSEGSLWRRNGASSASEA